MAFFDLEDEVKSEDHGLPTELIDIAANIRTDLDYFSDKEISTLMYHGYTLLNHRVKNYAKDLLENQDDISLKWIEEYSDERIKKLKHDLRNAHKSRIRPHKF